MKKKKLVKLSIVKRLIIGTGTIMYEWALFYCCINGREVVQRNVGIVWCEDSLGLGLTSLAEERLAERGCLSL